jgi:hypothetical protein
MKILFVKLFLLFLLSKSVCAQQMFTQTNQVLEWSYYSSKIYNDPFNEVELYAEIISESGKKQMLPAFWSGNNKWSFRYSNHESGKFTFKTLCNDNKNKSLHNQSGAIDIQPYDGKNQLLKRGAVKISGNNRYLEHQDGTPFFWLADSWWHGMTTRFKWPEDFVHLTQDRISKGFSVIQFAIAFPCDIVPFDPRGMNEAGNPWDEAWLSINPAYFDYTDQRVQYLVDQGLVPNIVGVWGYYIKFAGAEKLKKHWEYLIARYGAYPVSYTLCGESTLAWYDDLGTRWDEEKEIFREEWSKVAAHIKKKDPYQRVLTVHPGPNSGNFLPIKEMEHIDMVMLQSGHNGYFTLPVSSAAVDKGLSMYPDKPILHGEVCFEGMEGKSLADVQRYLFWSNMLKGTAGFSYGVEGIWQFNTLNERFGPSPGGNVWGNEPWEIASQYLGSKHVGVGKQILEELEWWRIQPAPERQVDPLNELLSQAVCAEIPGQCFIAYLFRKPSVYRPYRFSGFETNREISVEFMDPLTGEKYDWGKMTSDQEGVIQIGKSPIMQDWVVILRNAGK